MKTCPACGRTYAQEAVVCAYDEHPLSFPLGADSVAFAANDLKLGSIIGVYRILGEIGTGGMGVIYRAEHMRLGRKVALKVLRYELTTRTDVVKRFFEEARAVNEIGHPNIVDIIDIVEKWDQDPPLVYMVMELLSGQDLGGRIRQSGPLSPEETVSISCQVTEALIAVHRVKLLHRDLKPENIFLLQPNTEKTGQRVKLLDFGVARAFGDRLSTETTDPGTAVGTPEYMAPEQILGRELDNRTDIYALGLVMYDMLTGTVPFHSNRYGEVMVRQVKEAPEPVSSRRKQGPPVPPALEEVVMRCLRKDPAHRYQSMREVESALSRSIEGTPPFADNPLPVGGAVHPPLSQEPHEELDDSRELFSPSRRRSPRWFWPALLMATFIISGSITALFLVRRGGEQGKTEKTQAGSMAPQAIHPTTVKHRAASPAILRVKTGASPRAPARPRAGAQPRAPTLSRAPKQRITRNKEAATISPGPGRMNTAHRSAAPSQKRKAKDSLNIEGTVDPFAQ